MFHTSEAIFATISQRNFPWAIDMYCAISIARIMKRCVVKYRCVSPIMHVPTSLIRIFTQIHGVLTVQSFEGVNRGRRIIYYYTSIWRIFGALILRVENFQRKYRFRV